MSSDLLDQPLFEQARMLRDGTISAVELCQATFARIARARSINCYLTLNEAEALERAKKADQRLRNGDLQPLWGLPIAIKDNLCVSGLRMTCASRILENYRPPYDATVVKKLKTAGAILIGKTNLDEFAMGSSNENSAFGPCGNPWDPERIPGGSSGGSAAATAAGLASAALGSDTGGSIRQPAAMCGIVGLKPTYGRISRNGLTAFASSLDQIGPLARCARDAAILLQTIAGPDPSDSTCAGDAVEDYAEGLEKGVEGLRIGLPAEYFGEGIDAEVLNAIQEAIKVYERAGAKVSHAALPHSNHGIAAYYVLATAEASSNLARFDGIRYGSRCEAENLGDVYVATRTQGFGEEVKRRIMLGTFALSAGYYDAYYGKASRARSRIRADFAKAFEDFDLLLTPTSPTTAFRFGERAEPLSMYLADVFTVGANLAGIPGISIPAGFSSAGLPIGLQLLGPAYSEAVLLRAARAYERETAWHLRRPPIQEFDTPASSDMGMA